MNPQTALFYGTIGGLALLGLFIAVCEIRDRQKQGKLATAPSYIFAQGTDNGPFLGTFAESIGYPSDVIGYIGALAEKPAVTQIALQGDHVTPGTGILSVIPSIASLFEDFTPRVEDETVPRMEYQLHAISDPFSHFGTHGPGLYR